MTRTWKSALWARMVALTIVTGLVLPLAAGCGSKNDQSSAPSSTTITTAPPPAGTAPAPAHQGLTKGQKTVIVLAGAALLYYLYKKHQAQQAAGAATANGRPQLYRSRNGGIYYRDAQHNPVWVTAPAQQISVPADQVQQYAPDYQQYQGQPAPPAPPGYRTQSFSQLDPQSAQDASQ